jgi:hypothetical protein
MWEAIGKVLMSPNAGIVLAGLILVLVLLSVLSRWGLLSINTKGLSLGADIRERDIIRQQVEWAHSYISGLYSSIQPAESEYGGYFTRFLLELAYSEVVDWISFNHMKLDSEYIAIKQMKIKSIIYSYDIRPEFRTPKFEKQIDAWVEEVIKKLVAIRQMYK